MGNVEVFDKVVVYGDVCFDGSFGVFRPFSGEVAVISTACYSSSTTTRKKQLATRMQR